MKTVLVAIGIGLCAGCGASAAAPKSFISPARAEGRPWQVLENTMTTTQMRLFAVKTDDAPTIDGKLDDPAWRKAFSVSAFGRIQFRGYSGRKNSARLLYDDKAIYIGCAGELNLWHQWLAQARKKDGGAWQDESFEIFIDPNRTRKTYYQFIVNAVGSVQDGKGWSARYNAEWKAAVSHTSKSWTAEIMIPYSAVELAAAPKPGDVWGINICRNDKDIKETSSIIPVQKSFHDATKLAEIEFGDIPAVYLDRFDFDRITKGRNVLKFKALGSGVEGARVRATVTNLEGRRLSGPTETPLIADGITEMPFTITKSGQSCLKLELVKGLRTIGTYELLVIIYEKNLLILVPGQRDFYKGQKSLNLRFDIRLKEEALRLYGIKVYLKKGDDVLGEGTIANIPGLFTAVEMDISHLDVGTYRIEAALVDKSGSTIDMNHTTINVIRGPFARD